MSMGTISDIIGLVFFVAVAVAAWRATRASRRNPNRIDDKMYED